MKTEIEKWKSYNVIRILPSIFYYKTPMGYGIGFQFLVWNISLFIER